MNNSPFTFGVANVLDLSHEVQLKLVGCLYLNLSLVALQ